MTQSRPCPICTAKSAIMIHADFPGYVENTRYDIYECDGCNSQFVAVQEVDTAIYDTLYQNHDAFGYERYYHYAQVMKSQADPLKYLAGMEGTYNPVHAFLAGKKGLAILEVGSGYGYLTYSLNTAGHNAVGIDISSPAVEFARKEFGDFFWQGDLRDYGAEKKFDLIIATELIEHLADPAEFIRLCFSRLKENGSLLVTTPNKEYNRGAIWQTDLPPVHTVWLSRKSFAALAAREGLTVSFWDCAYDAKSENRLLIFLTTRSRLLPAHRMTAAGEAPGRMRDKVLALVVDLVKAVALFAPVRKLSNYLAKLLSKEPRVLCACLRRSGEG